MSTRIASALNADYDGDECNLFLFTTEKLLRNGKYMEPYNNILGLSGPDDFSNNIKMPKTITTTVSSWMNS
jgi:hypothetical protein